jgi:hypothetical protein
MNRHNHLSVICLLLLALPIITMQAFAKLPANINLINASTLTVIGRANPADTGFHRLNVDNYPDLTKTMRKFFNYSTGLAIAFNTNSRNIYARWTTTDVATGANMTPIAYKGLDLYIMRQGEWVHAGVGTPRTGSAHDAKIVGDMDSSDKLCLLYLPLYDEVKSLEIGIDSAAVCTPAPSPFTRRIVVVGSSITHGSSASRPGMAYPARISRATGCEVVNLGVAGVCRLEPVFAKIVNNTDADIFLFDTFSNPTPEQIADRLPAFVDSIRTHHKDTPLIFMQTEVRESGNFNLKIRDFEARKRQAAQAAIAPLLASDSNLYFINPFDLGTSHEATSDGVHPTDLGSSIFLPNILSALSPFLK